MLFPPLQGAGALALDDVQAAGKNKYRAVNILSLNGETKGELRLSFFSVLEG